MQMQMKKHQTYGTFIFLCDLTSVTIMHHNAFQFMQSNDIIENNIGHKTFIVMFFLNSYKCFLTLNRILKNYVFL